jgi:hypothetical protein
MEEIVECSLLRIRKIEEQYKYSSGKQYDFVVEAILDDTFFAFPANEEKVVFVRKFGDV